MTAADRVVCPVCRTAGCDDYATISSVAYLRCRSCGSLFAETTFLEKVARGEVQTYQQAYWDAEMAAARQRCFGSTPIRVAETLLYCRRPVQRFLDVGAGSGQLLDAMAVLLPDASDVFHAVDAFPPPPPHRTSHANFVEGSVAEMTGPFDAGVCIEVIEHLVPDTLRMIVQQLAAVSAPGALYYFNSGQPEYVEQEDPDYLEPMVRGHVVAYSLAGARAIFQPAGFNVIDLPGRAWAFLAEYGTADPVSRDQLYARLWNVLPENRALLAGDRFGSLLYVSALESARCFLELGRPATAIQDPLPPARRGLMTRILGRVRG